jgi:hypothetical protein
MERQGTEMGTSGHDMACGTKSLYNTVLIEQAWTRQPASSIDRNAMLIVWKTDCEVDRCLSSLLYRHLLSLAKSLLPLRILFHNC